MGQDSKTLIVIEPGLYIIIAAMLLLVPISWVISWFSAIVLHELFHCASLCLLGYRILEIKFRADGAKIISAPTAVLHGIICTAAGPIGSLLVLLFSAMMPRLSVCVLIQSAFNLLPVYPLDGGRVLRGLLSYMKNEKAAETLIMLVEWFVITLLLFGAILASFWLKLGFTPVLIPVFLLLKTQRLKIPCKRTNHRVQ